MSKLKKIVKHYNSLVEPYRKIEVVEGSSEEYTTINYQLLPSEQPVYNGTQEQVYWQLVGAIHFMYREYDIDEEDRIY